MQYVAVRTAAAVGALFGALSIVAGGRVLAGIDRPDYVVLPWLVIYNVAAGAVGIVAGIGLWQSRWWARGLVRAIAAAHAFVLIVLLARWTVGMTVAADSLAAMLLRTLVWAAIAVVAGSPPDGRQPPDDVERTVERTEVRGAGTHAGPRARDVRSSGSR